MDASKIKALVCVVVVFSLSGCVSYEQKTAEKAELERTTPKCYSANECELMWSAARRWVLDNAGFKLQHVTDDFLETYNPAPNSPRLAARVTKEPLADGSGYKIVIEAWCNNVFGCRPKQYDASLEFNKTVSNAKAPAF